MIAWTDSNQKDPLIEVRVREDIDTNNYFRLEIGKSIFLLDETEFLKLNKEVTETFLAYDFFSVNHA